MIAIDPGPTQSALVQYQDGLILAAIIDDNDAIAETLIGQRTGEDMAIEMVASYGMAVGKDVFETCVWIGRFIEAFPGDHAKVYRKDVKMHLCGNTKAKDSNIRQALIDRFGGLGGKEAAVGKKASPGPLYGVKSHLWSALAVAVTYEDTMREARA